MKKSIIISMCGLTFVSGVQLFGALPTNKSALTKTTLQGTSNASYSLSEGYSSSELNILKYWNNNGNIESVWMHTGFNTLGDGGTNTTNYYKWTTMGNGRKVLYKNGTASSYDLMGYVDSSSNQRLTADQNQGSIYHSFMSLQSTTTRGAAISYDNNSYRITNIFGDFVQNTVSVTASNEALATDIVQGGAIFNNGMIGNVSGSFIGNIILNTISNYSRGGALSNTYIMATMTGDYVGNSIVASGANHLGYGAAIYNGSTGTLMGLTGDYIQNSMELAGAGSKGYGGAVYNASKTIGTLTGNYAGNFIIAKSYAGGGAFYNDSNAKVGRLLGDYDGNYVITESTGVGGAIYNARSAEMDDIIGNFTGNYIHSTATAVGTMVEGGAVFNEGSMGIISGDFIKNFIKANYAYAYGGALYVATDILGTVTGLYDSNYIEAINGRAWGGAIYKGAGVLRFGSGTIFRNNYVSIETGEARGGAIYNYYSDFGDTVGDFDGNYAKATGTDGNARGGAVYAYAGLMLFKEGTTYENNYVSSESGVAQGGAIYNDTEGSTVYIDATKNYAESTSGAAQGGAIYSTKKAIMKSSTFTDNFAVSSSNTAQGGAIYNTGVAHITADNFTRNYAESTSGTAQGGAIYNTAAITVISDTLSGNYAKSGTGIAQGGAFYNTATNAENITGDFTGNYAQSTSNTAQGGAVYNKGSINKISSDTFNGNYVLTETGTAQGGAVYNATDAKISTLSGAFTQNRVLHNVSSTTGYTKSALEGGAIYNDGEITSIEGSFTTNYIYNKPTYYTYGGAISNKKTINSIKANFTTNYVQSVSVGAHSNSVGGAISNIANATIDSIEGNFSKNFVYSSGPMANTSQGGAIYNMGTIGEIKGNYNGNYLLAQTSSTTYASLSQGGAIYNGYTGKINSISGTFADNYASSSGTTNTVAQGGAIYNLGTMTIREGTFFTANYVVTNNGTRTYEAIYNRALNSAYPATINFNVYDSSKKIIVNDGINGDVGTKAYQILNINGPTEANAMYGTVEFNSFVNNQTVNVQDGTLSLGYYITSTTANITNTTINVESGATLKFTTKIDSNGVNNAVFTVHDAASKLTFANGAIIEVDLGNFNLEEDFNIELIKYDVVSDNIGIVLAALLKDDTTSLLSKGTELSKGVDGVDWDFVQVGNSIWLTGTVPEPSTYAAIFGALALAFAIYRRRK